MVRKPEIHEQFWAAIVGRYIFEDEKGTSRMAELLSRDVISLSGYDDMYELATMMECQFDKDKGQTLRMIFQDDLLKQQFVAFDARIIKQTDMHHGMVPPPCYQEQCSDDSENSNVSQMVIVVTWTNNGNAKCLQKMVLHVANAFGTKKV